MQEFLNIALGFPTVIWTGLVALVSAYWLFVILGALDLEILEFDHDFDFDADVDLDVDVDLDLDVDADVDADVHADLDGGATPMLKVAVALGVGKVPVTVLLSFFVISGWTVSSVATLYLTPILRFGAVGAVILGIAFVAAIPLMGALAHPLKGMFEMTTRRAGAEVIGSVCVISTGSVDERFGQARLDDGGAGLLLSVRCETENNGLKKNSQALIIGHDRETDVYFVEPYEQFLAMDGVEMATMDEVHEQSENWVNAKREG